jgi:hypothetical protein
MSRQKEHPREITAKKIAANQKNAQKSTGPHNCNVTRYNAVKHGLIAEGVTELDKPEQFGALVTQLKEELTPVGVLEQECVRQIALLTIRIRRARLLEAQAFTAYLNPPQTTGQPDFFIGFGPTEVIDPGLPAQVSIHAVDQINRTVLRYESAIENKLVRWQNQLERLQRRRQGEKISAPAAVDVNVHQESDDVGSFGNPTTDD